MYEWFYFQGQNNTDYLKKKNTYQMLATLCLQHSPGHPTTSVGKNTRKISQMTSHQHQMTPNPWCGWYYSLFDTYLKGLPLLHAFITVPLDDYITLQCMHVMSHDFLQQTQENSYLSSTTDQTKSQ